MKIIDYQKAAGEYLPEGTGRLNYISDADEHADWALALPGENPELWIVVIHGHGSHGDQLYARQDIRELWLPVFRQTGAGILTVNLRDNAWMGPAAVADMHDLIEWLRREYGMKKTIFASGSMGGTSNLIYAVLHPEDVSGVVARGAATDLASYYNWCVRQQMPIIQEIGEAIRIAYGGTPEQKPELYRRHSALANAARLKMPVFFAHGGADQLIPVEQARALADKLAGQKNFSYFEIPGGNHDSPLTESISFPKIISMI
ncbi:MAG: alpha/beta hydrolase [Victivallaceae bacterium]|jgi:pimeloyl-ACP methyl ester carboxylesterase